MTLKCLCDMDKDQKQLYANHSLEKNKTVCKFRYVVIVVDSKIKNLHEFFPNKIKC